MNKVYINDISNISVSNLCYETYPCKHFCKLIINNNDNIYLLESSQIIFILKKLNKELPLHFKKYSMEISNIPNYDYVDKALYLKKY